MKNKQIGLFKDDVAYLSTKQVIELLSISKVQLKKKLKEDKIVEGFYFYEKEKIHSFLKKSMKACKKCGKLFSTLSYSKVYCKNCKKHSSIKKGETRTYDNTCRAEDPYRVMVYDQYRGRKCPDCGVPVTTGQNKCKNCTPSKELIDQVGLVDDNYIYY